MPRKQIARAKRSSSAGSWVLLRDLGSALRKSAREIDTASYLLSDGTPLEDTFTDAELTRMSNKLEAAMKSLRDVATKVLNKQLESMSEEEEEEEHEPVQWVLESRALWGKEEE